MYTAYLQACLAHVPHMMLAVIIHVFALKNLLLQCLPLDSYAKIEQTTTIPQHMAKVGSPTLAWEQLLNKVCHS